LTDLPYFRFQNCPIPWAGETNASGMYRVGYFVVSSSEQNLQMIRNLAFEIVLLNRLLAVKT
jgi:hypothetical protein